MELEIIEQISESIVKAEKEIYTATGIPIKLLYEIDLAKKRPETMLNLIARTLEMKYSDYRNPSRKRDYVDLRFIGARFVRDYFPKTSLVEIARLFGGKDHTTIIHALMKCEELHAQSKEFRGKYNRVLNIITQWIDE